MKHFDITQWADYVRGLLGEADRAAMETHLASGCRKCQSAAELLKKVVVVARSHMPHEVPAYAVHCARAIYVLQQPEKVYILPRLAARLVYDSFREPLPAGVRAQQRLSRQALYEAGEYSLDLRLEHERGSSQVTLVGQIENREERGKRMAEVPVLLVSGKQVLAQSVSNALGEFQLEYRPAKHLRLYMPVSRAGKRIEVPLNHLSEEEGKGRKASAKQNRPSGQRRRPC